MILKLVLYFGPIKKICNPIRVAPGKFNPAALFAGEYSHHIVPISAQRTKIQSLRHQRKNLRLSLKNGENGYKNMMIITKALSPEEACFLMVYPA